jgi:hypothetical protein
MLNNLETLQVTDHNRREQINPLNTGITAGDPACAFPGKRSLEDPISKACLQLDRLPGAEIPRVEVLESHGAILVPLAGLCKKWTCDTVISLADR